MENKTQGQKPAQRILNRHCIIYDKLCYPGQEMNLTPKKNNVIIAAMEEYRSLPKEEPPKIPLSKITEEHCLGVCKILTRNGWEVSEDQSEVIAGRVAVSNIFNDNLDSVYSPLDIIETTLYLSALNYDMDKYK